MQPGNADGRFSAPLVGRDREVDALTGALARAEGAEGELWLLAGEPGIGKTRLAEELADRAAGRGSRVLWGRCWEGEGAPAFWPWTQVLRAYAASLSATAAPRALSPLPNGLARLVIDGDANRPPEADSNSEAREPGVQFQAFDAVTRILCAAAQRNPLVVVLDDLHWADKPSLLLLHFLARELRATKLLLVGTYRSGEVRPDGVVAQTLGGLAGTAQRLHLHGLQEEEHVASLVETATGRPAPQSVVASIRGRTNGNPFFIQELARFWMASPEHHDRVDIVPQSIRDSIRRRLAATSPGCRRVLEAASVFGAEFDGRLVHEVLSAAEGESDGGRNGYLTALDEAHGVGLLERLPTARVRDVPDVHRFAHDLIRETLYADLPGVGRMELHLAVGRALERAHATDVSPHLSEIAHHLCAALPAGDPAVATRVARSAARNSREFLAFENAALNFERALRAVDYAASLAADDERSLSGLRSQRCELLLELGKARAAAGDRKGTREALLACAALARELNQVETLTRAALALSGEGDVETEVDGREVELLEEALERLPHTANSLRACVMSRLARSLYFSHADADRRLQLSAEAVRLVEGSTRVAAKVAVLAERHMVLLGPQHLPERSQIARRAIELGRMSRRRDCEMSGYFHLLIDQLQLGDRSGAERSMGRFERLASQVRHPYFLWRARVLRGTFLTLRGELAAAEALIEEALDLGTRAQTSNSLLVYSVQLFCLRLEQDRIAELEPLIAQSVQDVGAVPAYRCGLAFLYSQIGEREKARAAFEPLAADGFTAIPDDAIWLNAMDELAQTCAFLGDVDRAAVLYERLLPYADQNVVIAFADGFAGSVARYLGLLATTMERWEDAQVRFDQAVHMHTKMGARPFLAHTQRDFAEMLLRRGGSGDVDRARKLLTAAVATYVELQMEGFANRARVRLADAGPSQPASEPASVTISSPDRAPAASAAGNLLRREGESWLFVYAGHEAHLVHLKGLAHLGRLLREPGREFHVADLLGLSGADGQSLRADSKLTIPDSQAKADYRRQLDSLRAALEEAEAFHEVEKAGRIHDEIEALTDELASHYGLRGHADRHRTPLERIRKSVTKSLRVAVRRIHGVHPAFGRHLGASLRTGTYCCYRPETEVVWTVHPDSTSDRIFR